MTTVTLDSIKAEQNRLAEMIASFEKQSIPCAEFHFPEAVIELTPGEHYAGIIIGKDGEPSHRLILLPGDASGLNWKDSNAWATGQGGELPTRREQSLLFANLKEQFEKAWYWSAETYEDDTAYAWYQFFGNGYQATSPKSSISCRALAVRRLVIE